MFINQNCLPSQPSLAVPTLPMEVSSHTEFSAENSELDLSYILPSM